ncbi:hypothetical protein ACFQT4_08265 [Pseudoduganella danionis]|uniref:hypothetical protein n=1 Tax=Pseudoduganella danionis TaxID=1890295 RepID=UPI0036222979
MLEYSVAYEMNHILSEERDGLSVSAVLWNVFPDLIIRNKQRENEIGLEVKALHTAAEEKSANLATPLQLIRYRRDFVVIINWGWQVSSEDGVSITYPHIHLGGVFDAWLLAKIRDYGWLLNQGGRIKGIDVATAIINSVPAHLFKAEEGNMGKLMRIQLPGEMPKSAPHYEEMKDEDERYMEFKQRVLALGLRETFLEICRLEGCETADARVGTEYPQQCSNLGNVTLPNGLPFQLIAGPKPEHWLRTKGDSSLRRVAVLWLGVKLEWKLFRAERGCGLWWAKVRSLTRNMNKFKVFCKQHTFWKRSRTARSEERPRSRCCFLLCEKLAVSLRCIPRRRRVGLPKADGLCW